MENDETFFSDKSMVFLHISIEKNNQIISDDFDLSEEFEDPVKSHKV